MNDPKFILVHHSATPDGAAKDYDAIKRYHTSWRRDGDIVSEAEARRLMAEGVRITPPWSDIGYHAVIEEVAGEIRYFKGRDFTTPGAHCPNAGMNNQSIGVCIVGNFDLVPPSLATLYFLRDFCFAVMVNWGIPSARVIGHREAGFMDGLDWKLGQFKTCPGKLFPMDSLRDLVGGKIDWSWRPGTI